MTLLYLSAATILLMRDMSALAHLQVVFRLFDTAGLARPTVPSLAGFLRWALFTLGSLIAAASVVFPRFGARRR